jgi:DNA-binding transcriptional LysR family regulator
MRPINNDSAMRGLKLDQLHAFAQVAELGGFSAAAVRLNLTQPAVSLQVRQLERRLGVRLLERVGKRTAPTLGGRELRQLVRRSDAAVAAATAAMAAHTTKVGGRVRLGAGATACIYRLPRLLQKLRARHPELEIVVKTGNTADILRALEENALDLALVTLPAPGRAFSVTPVLEDEFVAIFPAAEGAPREATPAALAQLPIVLFEPGANTRRLVDQWFARGRAPVRPRQELGRGEAIKELVAAGLGCSILPRMALTGAGRRDGVAIRSLTPRLYRQLGLVLRRDKPLHAGLRAAVAALTSLGGSPAD